MRVSTDEQATSGAGLAAQRVAIEAEASRRGWALLDVVEDAGFSGRDLRRPGIKAVLEALRSGRAAALIVAKVDRLSRSMVDFTALMDRSSREGWALVALDLGVDTSTPSGEAMVNVMATFSQSFAGENRVLLRASQNQTSYDVYDFHTPLVLRLLQDVSSSMSPRIPRKQRPPSSDARGALGISGGSYQFSARISKCACGWAQAGQAAGASVPA